ncbi:MAG TPA: TIM-barrel domain-containing protein [Chitinophagaceae bacterium]|nr:TIM-barrel domain-containing protein [Chitinophagaceae bacterium]
MKKTFFFILIVFYFIPIISGAQKGLGNFSSYKKEGNEYVFSTEKGIVKLSFCTPGMFRVRSSWTKVFEENEPWMVVKYNWFPIILKSSENKESISLQTSELTIKVSKAPFQINVYNKEGYLLSGEKVTSNFGGAFSKKDTVGSKKSLAVDEHFFGFGERMDFLDQRGKIVKLNVGRGSGLPHVVGAYNILEANYCPVPFFMSTKGYGIFFHTAYPTQWNIGATQKNEYTFSASGGELDYYFINGPKFSNILSQYTTLTGKAPLMPQFAYGLHLGTYSGGTWGFEASSSDKYVIELVRQLRAMGIPVDILWLDSTWRIFGEVGGKGATSFEWRDTFKDPKGMFDSLYALNIQMVGLHLRPRFDNGKRLKLLDTAQKLKYTYPEEKTAGEFVNFFDSSSVDWWWDHGVKRVAKLGARFLKTDEGSAFGALANESDKIGPTGKDIAKLHNLFPIAYAKAPFEKFQQFNNVRGLNQTREGYAGIQRYPYIFAGDWPSEWQYFAPVIKGGLNIGLSGVGNWAHCMGGFEHVADPELYIRWVQMGMLSPVAMVFGMDHPGYKEPWKYGADALRNFKKYDSLRYSLLPYIYSNAWQMFQTGEPLMRALVLDYQDDENVYEIGDQYLFGHNIMVCPVVTKGAQTRTVYLPEGEWYNYWTGEKHVGKQYLHILTPLDSIPLFIKSGSIIPSQSVQQYVGEKKIDTLTIDIYPGTNSTFDLYEDDGKSMNYIKGAYSVTKISVVSNKKSINVKIQEASGNYIPLDHHFVINIHDMVMPKSVQENGKHLLYNAKGWQYIEQKKILKVFAVGNNKEDMLITVDLD